MKSESKKPEAGKPWFRCGCRERREKLQKLYDMAAARGAELLAKLKGEGK